MTHACSAWEFAADTHVMKLQHLQNTVLRIIRKFPRSIPIRDMGFKILCMYNYIAKLSRQQTQIIQGHENAQVRNIGQGKARCRK
jgi:hypothetical protein